VGAAPGEFFEKLSVVRLHCVQGMSGGVKL
jgi:hypothetical protein